MSNLNDKFDVKRGWAGADNTNTVIDETFEPVDGITPSSPLYQGEVVKLNSNGKVERATAADYGGAADVSALANLLAEKDQLWLTLGGSTEHEYDSQIQTGAAGANGAPSYETWKVTCIRGTFMVKTEQFVDQSYSPGDPVTVVNGQIDLIDSGGGTNTGFEQYGEVVEYDSSAGTLIVSV